MMKTERELFRVRDGLTELSIPFEACRLYHGEDSIGGLALGFRLLVWAAQRLSPDRVPERSEIRFRTAFPGPGVRDAVEMLTRAVSRGDWEVLGSAPPDAPEGVYGHLYFEIGIGERSLGVSVAPGVMSGDFIRTGRAVKAGGAAPELLRHWAEVKRGLAAAVMAADMDAVLRMHFQR